jgi:hypothetical protein
MPPKPVPFKLLNHGAARWSEARAAWGPIGGAGGVGLTGPRGINRGLAFRAGRRTDLAPEIPGRLLGKTPFHAQQCDRTYKRT